MDVPTQADIRADARRTFRWSSILPGILWGLATYQAIAVLERPTTIGTARLLWALLPLPFMVWGFLSWGKTDNRQSEFEREVNQQAAAFAYRLTIFWLFGLAVLNAAVGLPMEVWTPISGVRDTIGWKDLVMLPPLFFSLIGYIVVRRKVFPRQ
ncbi:MAG: hypothetical protein V4503_06810 [Gemmatimonadota bacterium]